jgi:hypothetical protein
MCGYARRGSRDASGRSRGWTGRWPPRPDVTAQAAPSGYGPSDLQSAYDLPSATAGGSATVAIVDAYNNPDAAADLATYRAQYGLRACTVASGCFRVVNEEGQASPLPADAASDTGYTPATQTAAITAGQVTTLNFALAPAGTSQAGSRLGEPTARSKDG